MASKVPLDIAIVGAGIAGLAAALAISKQDDGHRVTVYEAQPSLSEFGAGIQLAANATRIVYSLGLADEFKQVTNYPKTMEVRRYANDAIIGEIAQNPQSEWDYGFPHWQVFRPDFQRLLAEACEKEGEKKIKVMLGWKVKSADANAGKLIFENGEEVHSDLIIAADGLRGKLRSFIPQNEGIQAEAFNEFCFRAVVPRERMLKYPETAELMQAGSLNMVWCGPGIGMLGYPVAAGSLYNIVLSVPRPADEDAVGKWSQPGDIREGAELLKPFCERTKKVWSLVEECNKWTLGDLPPLPTFVSDRGNLVLLGDCAHAILHHSGQGGGMALEDAGSLGVFISAIKDKADIPRFMRAWNDLRQERVAALRQYAAGNQQFLTTPDGPAQEKRDQLWAVMTAAWKKELAELGEDGYKKKPKANAVPPSEENKDMRSPETRMYLFGYDAIGEAAKVVQKLQSESRKTACA